MRGVGQCRVKTDDATRHRSRTDGDLAGNIGATDRRRRAAGAYGRRRPRGVETTADGYDAISRIDAENSGASRSIVDGEGDAAIRSGLCLDCSCTNALQQKGNIGVTGDRPNDWCVSRRCRHDSNAVYHAPDVTDGKRRTCSARIKCYAVAVI